MGNDLIRQRKELAMGKDVDVGGDCASAFNSGASHNDGSHRRKASKDSGRAQKHLSNDVDHGPHGMNTPRGGYLD